MKNGRFSGCACLCNSDTPWQRRALLIVQAGERTQAPRATVPRSLRGHSSVWVPNRCSGMIKTRPAAQVRLVIQRQQYLPFLIDPRAPTPTNRTKQAMHWSGDGPISTVVLELCRVRWGVMAWRYSAGNSNASLKKTKTVGGRFKVRNN